MFLFILNILLISSVFAVNKNVDEISKFDIKAEPTKPIGPPVTYKINFEDLRQIIEDNFNNDEKQEKFSVQEGFYKDFL